MITRLQVKGFKSLYDLDVRLTPLTVLFGANTSGKSNVLDVIQLLSRLATAENIVEAFKSPFRGTPLSCFSLDDRGEKVDSLEIMVEFDFDFSVQSTETLRKKVSYELVIRYDANERYPYVAKEALKDITDGSERNISLGLGVQGRSISYDSQFFDLKPENPTRTQLSRFKSAFSLYGNQVGDMAWPLAACVEMSRWQFFSFDPQSGLRAINEVFTYDAQLGSKGENLGSFLYTLKIKKPFEWETFQKALKLYIPEIDSVEVLLNKHDEVEIYVQERNKKIPIRLMSDGTLNLMGLLTIGSLEGTSVVGIDEPENGIHPSKMSLVARLLETQASVQQLIVTTHSPHLLDHVALESVYACQKKNGQTRVLPVKELPVVACLNDDILLSDLIAAGAFNG